MPYEILTAKGERIEMQGIGSPTLAVSQSREAIVKANTNYTVPAYVVGNHGLQIFLDGVLCVAGTDASTCTYKEIGAAGSSSTTIQFLQDIPVDIEITARVN